MLVQDSVGYLYYALLYIVKLLYTVNEAQLRVFDDNTYILFIYQWNNRCIGNVVIAYRNNSYIIFKNALNVM